MTKPSLRDRIISDPQIMVGKTIVKGTRIPVERVLHHLEENLDLEDLFATYPDLTTDDVKACLGFARAALADDATQKALAAIGSWSDLDWDEAVDELDRIRHESRPTPPIDLDL